METDSAIDRSDRWDIRHFPTIDSTNRWVLDEARAGAPSGLVASADHQSAGRGRLGRAWVAPPGTSLLVSVLLRLEIELEKVNTVAMAASLALLEGLPSELSSRSGLKWPNDVVVGDRKLAGVLAESILPPGDKSNNPEIAVVVGVGCNLEQKEFPAEVSAIATSCALELEKTITRDDLLNSFLSRLAFWSDEISSGNHWSVISAYRARLVTLGTSVRVDLGNETFEGIATDIDSSGRLLVTKINGEHVVVSVGDVVHLRSF